jgi:glycosyltransferase involved in cell wall biosynthesis
MARVGATPRPPERGRSGQTSVPDALEVPRATRTLAILWVDEQLPEPSRDSGSLRMFNLMRLLVAMGHTVNVLALSRSTDQTQKDLLQDIGVQRAGPDTVLRPEAWFARNGKRYDAVIVSRYHLAWSWFPLIRRVHPKALKILDTVDLHHVREMGEADLRGNALLRLAARATRRHELRAIRNADVTWVVSAMESRLLENIAPGSRTQVISNVHAVPPRAPDRHPGAKLVFVGGAQHPPNVDGVRWLLSEILPKILRMRPDCRLHLVGRGLEECARDLPIPSNTVFHGQLQELEALLGTCHVGLAPLRFGAGVKGKINHYMAFGLPTVATAVAVEGMHLKEERDVLLADDADAFSRAVIRLLDDQALWKALSTHGRENVRRHFSIESATLGIQATFDHRTLG